MSGNSVYIAHLAATVARALGNVSQGAGALDTAYIGYQLPDVLSGDGGIEAASDALADAGAQLAAAADALDAAVAAPDNDGLAPALIAMAEALFLFVNAGIQFANALETAATGLTADEAASLQDFAPKAARRVLDAEIILWLEFNAIKVAIWLKALGLIEWEEVPATGAKNVPAYTKRVLRLDRIKSLLTDPAEHFSEVYGWGDPSFDPEPMMQALRVLFHESSDVEVGNDAGDAYLTYGQLIWSRDSDVAPPGLRLDYFDEFVQSFSERVEINDTWGTDFAAELALGTGFALRLAPPFDISLEPKAGTLRGQTSFAINRNETARGFTIVGGNDLIRLEAENAGAGASLEVGADTTGSVSVNPKVHADLSGLTLRLGAEGSDNFLASLLADADIEGVFDLGVDWSLAEGFAVRATGGIEVAIPMYQDLGPFEFQTLYLILKIEEDGGLSLETSAAVTANIGPLAASVERMGAKTTLSLADGSEGAFGPVDLAVEFKPPSGVGLSLDAGVVKGGGYLYLDYEAGEYAGAMELTFPILSVKALGLINTVMPDGSDGFSMLIIVTAEFGTPIQLGFGFTLSGLGGLLGLNRTMVLEEMAEGVRTGAIDGIMFPTDVVANAPQIISDMRRFFPPEEGTFLIGPMAKIGWGTPNLVTLSLGVVIEVPPGNVAILGVLKCALPDEDAALLVLQVSFIGAIEVDQNRLWFFASLYGSRVLFIDLTGEMGLLVAWGDNADFVLSVGGFHPDFTPPPLPFPSPGRIGLSILDESWARISVQGYFAVTSNTAQFGAAVDLFFGMDAFSVEGEMSFDALFQFSPFYFTITFSASLSVKLFGAGFFSVRIRGGLEGVAPWHVEGEGSISLLFVDVDVPFSHTWGDNAATVLPDVDALPLLIEALEKDEAWVAVPPEARSLSVTLREVDPSAELLMHPSGHLRVMQRTMPLALKLDTIGNKAVADIDEASITTGAGTLVETGRVREKFATAQYRTLEESDKISAPGFEEYDAGVELASAGEDLQSDHAVRRDVLQELVTFDSNYKKHVRKFVPTDGAVFDTMLSSNATARAVNSQFNRAQVQPFDDHIEVTGPAFAVASTETNAATATCASQAEANDALARELAINPHAELHVIPETEAA